MVACQNCGHTNPEDCNFCRFCGTKLNVPIAQRSPAYNYVPPRPYAWKTDEFQTQNEARQPTDSQPPAPFQPAYPGSVSSFGFAGVDANYRCPRCGTSYLPVMEKRVSTAGWIVFSVLLVFTLIFFWIGLLMKENVAVCPVCRTRLN